MGTRGATNVHLQKARLNGNRCLCANWLYEHAARVAHTTLINNSRVLVSGGTGSGSAELYDPATGAFTLTENPSDVTVP